MASQKWSEVFSDNPTFNLKYTDILNIARPGEAPTAGEWGQLSSYNNKIFVSDLGADDTGNGSLLCPFASISQAQTEILSRVPSEDNQFIIYDMRSGNLEEPIVLLPFVSRYGNKSLNLNVASLTLHPAFETIATDATSLLGGYNSLIGGVNLDFSVLGSDHAAHIFFENVERAELTGQYIGKDGANFTNTLFKVTETSFNTAGSTPDNEFWSSDISISSGINRTIRNSPIYNCSSITKGLGSTPTVTELNVAFCGFNTGHPETGFLEVINTGGVNNQPHIRISAVTGLSTSGIALSIDSDGQSPVEVIYDITTGYYIYEANNLTNIHFNNLSYSDDLLSNSLSPINFTRTGYTSDGFTYAVTSLGAMLNGIDIALGERAPAPVSAPTIDADFVIPDSPSMPLPQTWVIASSPLVPITVTLPANPFPGEKHSFICVNGGQQVTIESNGSIFISGSVLNNVLGVANITVLDDASSVDLVTPANDQQVIELVCNNSVWVPFYSMGFS